MTETGAVDLGEVVHVLRLARDNQLSSDSSWTSDGFASAVWNGLITGDDDMGLTEKGSAILAKFGPLYREGR